MILRETLKEIIMEQRSRRSDMQVPRELMSRVQPWFQNQQIIILTGLRRSGKSTFVNQIRQLLHEIDFCLNFEDERLVSFTVGDFQKLLEVFIELFGVQKTVFFDEIQNIDGWERFIRRLQDDGYKIYITGSNAHLLSSELGTHLTGRYFSAKLFPYSFREYLISCEHPSSDPQFFTTAQRALHKKWLNEYIEEGGVPEYLKNKDPYYLTMLYENILYRDIITRYQLSNEKPIKELACYLASNLGKTITFSSLKKILGLGSGTTVAQYCEYFENSYLFFIVNRYDASLKRQMLAPKKAYIIDNAMGKVLGFRTSEDAGRFLENTVFLELKRRNEGEIYYHSNKRECDFVMRKGQNIIQAIQVCQSLQNEITKKREYEGLIEALQTYGLNTGLILTEDERGDEIIENQFGRFEVKIQPVWEWLLFTIR